MNYLFTFAPVSCVCVCVCVLRGQVTRCRYTKKNNTDWSYSKQIKMGIACGLMPGGRIRHSVEATGLMAKDSWFNSPQV